MAEESQVTEPVVTDRGPGDTPTVVSTTPMKWYTQILVRAARAGLAAFMGYSGFIAIKSGTLPPEGAFLFALKIAGTSAAWSVLQNSAELLARIDQTGPQYRA